MKNRNKDSTRYWSSIMESSVAKALGGKVVPNSGAIKFGAGDVVVEEAGLLLECKTSMSDKDSFSIKKNWIIKNNLESFSVRKPNQALSFRFGPNQENYYVISEKYMKMLVEVLSKDENRF